MHLQDSVATVATSGQKVSAMPPLEPRLSSSIHFIFRPGKEGMATFVVFNVAVIPSPHTKHGLSPKSTDKTMDGEG